MTPFYTDDWLTLYGGDCREVLASLPADSVDCVVTSPPYWGLRDYGTATWEGGDAECDHKNTNWDRDLLNDGGNRDRTTPMKDRCRKCGATRIDSQLGLERTPEEYVANMVAVFREVRRVLKAGGTCWLNLGDSYAHNTTTIPERKSPAGPHAAEMVISAPTQRTGRGALEPGLKPKDLVGIPWRVAFALQADGWYLRSDIIWSKPNPMPESVTDRPTKSHEYLFLLTKSARYYFDADAVREPQVVASQDEAEKRMGRYGRGYDKWEDAQGFRGNGGGPSYNPAGRNIRSVWNIATRPYPGAHFAVFPPELPERCIKAGSSEKGVCPECGAPWERIVERTTMVVRPGPGRTGLQGASVDATSRTAVTGTMLAPPSSVTTGWQPTCDCALTDRGTQPSVILDPFGGSGTVGMVANRLSRRAILIDLNPSYLQQQLTRNAQTPLGLKEGDAA